MYRIPNIYSKEIEKGNNLIMRFLLKNNFIVPNQKTFNKLSTKYFLERINKKRKAYNPYGSRLFMLNHIFKWLYRIYTNNPFKSGFESEGETA